MTCGKEVAHYRGRRATLAFFWFWSRTWRFSIQQEFHFFLFLFQKKKRKDICTNFGNHLVVVESNTEWSRNLNKASAKNGVFWKRKDANYRKIRLPERCAKSFCAWDLVGEIQEFLRANIPEDEFRNWYNPLKVTKFKFRYGFLNIKWYSKMLFKETEKYL